MKYSCKLCKSRHCNKCPFDKLENKEGKYKIIFPRTSYEVYDEEIRRDIMKSFLIPNKFFIGS